MWPFMALIQLFSLQTMVTGSFSIMDCSRSRSISGASAKSVRLLPSGVFLLNFSLTALISSEICCHCWSSDLRRAFRPFCSLIRFVILRADFHFLKLAQGAQPHVQNGFGLIVGELEALHQRGLGLILLADDADDFIEVEIGDEIAAENFKAPGDFGEAEIGAADQNGLAVLEAIRAAHRPAT